MTTATELEKIQESVIKDNEHSFLEINFSNCEEFFTEYKNNAPSVFKWQEKVNKIEILLNNILATVYSNGVYTKGLPGTQIRIIDATLGTKQTPECHSYVFSESGNIVTVLIQNQASIHINAREASLKKFLLLLNSIWV